MSCEETPDSQPTRTKKSTVSTLEFEMQSRRRDMFQFTLFEQQCFIGKKIK